MAEIAVQVVLVLAEQVIIFLNKKFSRWSINNNLHDDVERARRCLERMRAYLSDNSSSELTAGFQVLQTRVGEIGDIAYEIEDVLDKFLLHVPHQFHSNDFSRKVHYAVKFRTVRTASHELSGRIKYIVDEKLKFLSTLDTIYQVQGRDQESRPSSSTTRHGDSTVTHHNQFLEEEEIVGFEEPKEKLISQLMEGDPRFISLVGPGGSGKTTLLKNVFESKKVQRFFECHAWIDVPRDLCARKLDELLLNMLSKFDPKGKRKEPVIHEDPKAQLIRASKDKKFVVVLDNVWSEQDLKCIVDALPKGLPGSKIVITTRYSKVASCHAKSSYIHNMSNVFSWEKAWNLFCRKAFHDSGGKCPTQILDWAEKIVKKCEGLPLAISAAGTLLATKLTSPRDWKKLHDSLGSNVPIITQILQPSYKDLPSHLKTCFLYFGMFPEDYSISRERLIRLWEAEGFVMQSRSRIPMEEVAEDYLNELIGRNLVHVSSREVDGRVRSCRVLNLVREFIIGKAEKENFIRVLKAANRTGTAPGEKIRRLSVHDVSEGNNFSSDADLSCTRTILLSGRGNYDSELERLLKTFEFLRVLNLQGINLDNFPDSVFGLTLLRYVSLRHTNIKKVPKSIKKLGFLETLDLKHTKVTNLPKQIYKLHNLRHLLVYRYDVTNYVTFEAAKSVGISEGNISSLSSIQKLSLISVRNNRKIITALGELKGLRKLGLTDLKKEDGRKLCCSLQEMEKLSTLDVRSTSEEEFLDLDYTEFPPDLLQRLYLKGRLERLPKWISKLNSVAKIGLKWSKLQANENPLEALQALPNLMELDLVQYHTGAELEFKAKTFNMLKILHIEQFDQLNMMVVENGAMPKLEKLIMSRCQNLRLLPLGMKHLTHLDELLLYDMPVEFINKLGKDSEDRADVEHIRVIHSFHLGGNQAFTGFRNLS